MSYNLKQSLSSLEENNFETEITAELEAGKMMAIIENRVDEGSAERSIKVQVMPLEVAEAGTQTTNTNVFTRKEGEESVKVTLVDQDGKELDTCVQSY